MLCAIRVLFFLRITTSGQLSTRVKLRWIKLSLLSVAHALRIHWGKNRDWRHFSLTSFLPLLAIVTLPWNNIEMLSHIDLVRFPFFSSALFFLWSVMRNSSIDAGLQGKREEERRRKWKSTAFKYYDLKVSLWTNQRFSVCYLSVFLFLSF